MRSESSHPFLQSNRPVDWSALQSSALVTDIRLAIAQADESLRKIGSIHLENATYSSVIEAMDEALRPLSEAWSLAGNLSSVRMDADFRKAYNEILPEVSDFYSGICLRDDLWQRVRKVADDGPLPKDPVKLRHLRETRRDFAEAGAELSEEDKKKLQEIESELASATQKFSENVLDATEAWEKIVTDPKVLDGLPESALHSAREDARAKGYGDDRPAWRFSLHAPSYLPVLQYAHSDNLRKEIWEAATAIGSAAPYDNRPLALRILELRTRKISLLGFENFAEYTTLRRMVGSGQAALRFIEDLHERIQSQFNAEIDEVERFRAEECGDDQRRLEPWEIGYWSERLRKSRYDFDEEELRKWFPIEKVQSGLFDLVEKVFAVRIAPRDPGRSGTLWNENVEFYDLYDGNGDLLGSFYADWYPREGKRSGAWMNPLLTGVPTRDILHYGIICGNMTPPAGDKASLLTHREVETIFHEFGHLLHHMCSKVEVRDLSGTSVAWDFVELPSQIMENWCWERESLDLFARHHETGEPLPEDLYQKMRKARNFQSATQTMRQLLFAKMDLELHRGKTFASVSELTAFLDSVLKDYRFPTQTKSPEILPRFTHLFGSPTGYAAGYYSYKYAEMLDADAFGRFLEEGLLNPEVGREFREKILARGNSAPPETLFSDFRGRDPDPEALLKRAGLVSG